MTLLSVRGLHAGYGPLEVLYGIDLDVNEGEFVAFMASNKDLAPYLVFELSQASLERHADDGLVELGKLGRLGFRLSMDQVTTLDFDVAEGEVVVILGANGAGKTTLFSIITGFQRPTSGHVRYGGADITGEPPHRLARRGIARTFQIVQPFAALSVRENIAVGSHLRHAGRADALDAASAVGESVGLGGQLDKSASVLTVAGRKRLELARALATEPRVLLLDEPMAGLGPVETERMIDLLKRLQSRYAMLLVEHDMHAVFTLATRWASGACA